MDTDTIQRMSPGLVVFDMIGTTIAGADTVAEAFREAVAARGLAVPAGMVARVRGLNKADAFRALAAAAGASGDALEATARDLHASFTAQLDRQLETAPPREVTGAGRTFEWLASRGVRIALASGLDRAYVDAVMARVGWPPGLVSVTVCATDVAHGRPAPDLIHEAMRRAHVTDPARVIAVGDTVADLAAAAAARVGAAIAVLSGAGREDALRAVPHDAVLGSVADLPEWIEAHLTL
jgi:phosphonatase-like hydrolase